MALTKKAGRQSRKTARQGRKPVADNTEANTPPPEGQVNAAIERKPPQPETGLEQKKANDFSNLLQELVHATETEDRKLVVWYANELREKYRSAVKFGG
jgi:hypothetical protein